MTEPVCRHCNRPLEPCNCGASGTPHWIDANRRRPWEFVTQPAGSRWCARPVGTLHEPAESGS